MSYSDIEKLQILWYYDAGMLVRRKESFPIEGSSWHYSFPGTDGSVYEFSYDFHDDELGWYYYRDGEKTKGLENFDEDDILELTGLKVDITNWSDYERGKGL